MSKVDYRTVITKQDILTIRRALREAVFFFSQEGVPPSAAPQLAEFKALLKKLNGLPIQRLMNWKSADSVGLLRGKHEKCQ